MKKIAVSIQASDILNIRSEINKYLESGINTIHMDIMDHKFANNFAFSIDFFKAIKKEFGKIIKIDLHFMIESPEEEIKKYLDLHPRMITVDARSMDLNNLISLAKLVIKNKIKFGISIQLKDDVTKYKKIFPFLDQIMFMSVPIGKSGQKFDKKIYENLNTFRSLNITKKPMCIGIDGGVRKSNFSEITKSGFNYIVIGSILKGEQDYGKIIKELKHNLWK